MPELVHTTPCPSCPLRRASAPGWLGAATAVEFVDAIQAEAHMPCHAAVDYEDEGWRDQLEDAPRCAGSLVFMRNSCQLPRDGALRSARDAVAADHAGTRLWVEATVADIRARKAAERLKEY